MIRDESSGVREKLPMYNHENQIPRWDGWGPEPSTAYINYDGYLCTPREQYGGCDCNDRGVEDFDRFESSEPLPPKVSTPEKWAPSSNPDVWHGVHGPIKLTDMSDIYLARALATTIQKDGLRHPRAKGLLAELARRSGWIP